MSEPVPQFVETPPSSVVERQIETVIIDRFRFQIERPADSYSLLDDPVVRAAHERDEYMPYWADIWPAGRMLAKAIAKEDWSKYKTGDAKVQAVELGCGLGIPGLTALACGLHVTFTDYDVTALHFVSANARRNKLYDFTTMPLDWRVPPSEMKFPVILAADVTYEERNIAPLVSLIRQVLLPGGVCLMTDQDRTPAPILRQTLVSAGLRYTQSAMKAGEPGGYRVSGSLYRVTRDA